MVVLSLIFWDLEFSFFVFVCNDITGFMSHVYAKKGFLLLSSMHSDEWAKII